MDYSSYLKVKELIELQKPLSKEPEHDEMLFIVIHQSYELWFKQVLHEIDFLNVHLSETKLAYAQKTLSRILVILKTLVAKLDILETMTPLDFLSFRSRLENSSGFQSFQFRAIEFALGKKDPEVLERFKSDNYAYSILKKRFIEPSIWSNFLALLNNLNYDVPRHLFNINHEKCTQENPKTQEVLIDIYNNNPEVMRLCELLVDLDEGMQEWRYRHVKMVERTIGTKMGTGGSKGTQYLIKTLFKPLFPDLWSIRSEL